MARLESVLRFLSGVLVALGCVGILMMMLQITADALGRYLFTAPLPATVEFTADYYMPAVAFLAIAHVQAHRRHIVVELFTQNMAPRRLLILEGCVYMLCAAVCLALAYSGFENALKNTLRGEFRYVIYFDMITWPSRWFVPAGFGLTGLLFLVQGAGDLAAGIAGRRGVVARGAHPTADAPETLDV